MAYNIIVDYTNTEVGYVNGPITVARAKAFCRVENTTAEQDIDFALWIRAARTKIEQYTGLSLIPRNIVAVLQAPQGMMELPFGPVTNTPTFVDENDTAQEITLIGLNYKVIKDPIGYTKATYTAGFADGQVPEELQEAILLQVAYWWENRGDQDVQGWSNQVIAIVQKWKRF
jgi:hypothetical protein